jgi:hypothetical protein
MIQDTLVEFLLAEGIKQLMMGTTAGFAVSANATKSASDTSTAVGAVVKSGAVAGAESMAWAAKLGPWGLIAGAALASLFIAGIMKFMSMAKSGGTQNLAAGGLVQYRAGGGGIFQPSGTDTVPAMLTPGEFVLSKPLVDNIRSGKSPSTGRYAAGGLVSGSSAPVASNVTVQMNTFAVPNRAEFRRWYRNSVTPNTKSMHRRGQM